MMRVTMSNQEGLLRQAAIWHGQDAMRAESVAFGVIDKDGRLHAVVTMDNHTATSCDLHIASNGSGKWATRKVIKTICAYVFDHLGLIKVKTTVPHWNIKALVMCLHLGLKIEGSTKCGAHDGSDGVCFGMIRSECPWLAKREQDNG